MADRAFLKTPEFRGSFVNFAKPRAQKKEDGTMSEPKFSVAVVLPMDAPATKAFIPQLEQMLLNAYTEAHGSPLKQVAGKPAPTMQQQLAALRAKRGWPIKDGASIGDEGNFTGNWFFRASSNFKPDVCDIHGQKIDGEVELYSGAWYRCKISAWAWNHATGGKGVSINIETAMKTRDDDKFGGGGNAANDFADEMQGGEQAEDPAPAPKGKPTAKAPPKKHSMLD